MAVAVAMTASCTNANEVALSRFNINVLAEVASARSTFGDKTDGAYLSQWSGNETALFNLNGASTLTEAKITGSGASAEFSVSLSGSTASSGTIYAYSPKGVYSTSGTSVGGFTGINTKYKDLYVVVPNQQTPLRGSCDERAHLLVAKHTYSGGVPSRATLQFRHAAAYGKMTLTGLAGEEVATVSISSPVAIAGTGCYYYYSGDNEGQLLNATLSTITLDASQVSDNVFWFGCAPASLGDKGTLTITVTTKSGKTLSRAISMSGRTLDFVQGEVSVFTVDMQADGGDTGGNTGGDDTGGDDTGGDDTTGGNDVTTTQGWLELPAPRTDGRFPNAAEYLVKASTGERNYTHYYDKSTYTTLWVAYPIESWHMGSISRPNSWSFNPLIEEKYQVNLCSRSYTDTYVRGHLIPNAARNGHSEMQKQTFYVTNSVPQIHENFNSGIWQSLEAALQSIGEQETIYIVTGVMFNKEGESKTINYTTAKDDTKQVPVPNYFYKVALKVKTSSSGQVTSASTVGFWFENKAYSGSTYSNYTVSVDQVEAWTGFDFFANLPDSIEQSVEQNTSWTTFKNF